MEVNNIKTFFYNTSLSIFVNQGAQNVKFFIFGNLTFWACLGSLISKTKRRRFLYQCNIRRVLYITPSVLNRFFISVIFFKKIGYQNILAIIYLIVDFARLWLGHKDLLTVFGQHTWNFHNFSLILAIFYIYMSDRFRE